MLVFFPPLYLGILAAYVVAVSTAPSISTAPGVTNAANLDDPGPPTDLALGDPINVAHKFPVADSFIQSGAREHSIKPGNHFAYLEADDTPEDLNATVEGIANVKLLSGPLAAPRRVHDKRDYATFERCTQAEVEGIQLAIYSIWQEASTAYFGIWGLKEKHNDGWAVRYKRWFGPYTKPRYKTVKKLVWFMAKKVRFKNFVFRCRTGERDRAPARLIPGTRRIEVFQGFWDSVVIDRMGTLLHIAAHRNIHIRSSDIGSRAARQLAISGSNDALFNFYNYDGFIRNLPDPIPQ